MKLKNWVRRCIPALLAMVLIMVLAVPARAVVTWDVISPLDLVVDIVPQDDGYLATLAPSPEYYYWERYRDSTLRNTYVGNSITFSSQSKLIDNVSFKIYPLGSTISVLSVEEMTDSFMGRFNSHIYFDPTTLPTEEFTITLIHHIVYIDEQGNLHDDDASESWSHIVSTDGSAWDLTYTYYFYIDKQGGGDWFYPYLEIQFSGIDDETDTTSVYFAVDSDFTLQVPLADVYGDFYLNSQSNAYLDAINQKLESQGQTMEDMLSQQEQTNEKLDGIQDSMDQANDQLEDLITGGDAGQDLIDKTPELDSVGDTLDEDVGQIQDFEDQYFQEFEDNLDDIVDGSDISLLADPLVFVQKYLNYVVQAIPTSYMVVLTLPLLLGIFLYIVGHPVRVAQPPNDDESIRETFTTRTYMDGPKAGQSSTTHTITRSRRFTE